MPRSIRSFVGGVVAVAATMTVAFVTLSGLGSEPTPAQPMRFDHAVHVKEAKCTKCHRTVNTAARAGVPTLKTCHSCHKGDPLSTKPEDLEEEKKLDAMIEHEQEIRWARLVTVPAHTFFPHQAHVLAKIDCRTCHGPIGTETVLPAGRPASAPPLTMNACMRCHAETKADNECLACHR